MHNFWSTQRDMVDKYLRWRFEQQSLMWFLGLFV